MDINTQRNFENVEIDLKRVIEAVISNIRLIITITVIVTLISALVSVFLISKKYTATARFYVTNNKDIVSQNIDSTDIDASTKLVPTYVEMLKSKTIIGDVIEEAKLECSVEQLAGMISIGTVTDTQILSLNVVSDNPDDAYILANAMADIAPEKITEVMNGSVIKIVDYAEKPSAPSSPNVKKNIMFGFMLGLILSFAMVILIEINDSSVKSEEDLTNMFAEIPVIGVIPDISVESITSQGGE